MDGALSDTRKAFYDGLRTGVSSLVRDAARWLGIGVITGLTVMFGTQEGRHGLQSSFPTVPSRPPEASSAVEALYQSAMLAATGCAMAGTLAGTLVGFWLRQANIAIIPRECGRGRWLFAIGLVLGLGFTVAGLSYFVISGTFIHPAMLFDPFIRDEVQWPVLFCIMVSFAAYILAFCGGYALTAPRALRVACTPWPLCHLFRPLS